MLKDLFEALAGEQQAMHRGVAPHQKAEFLLGETSAFDSSAGDSVFDGGCEISAIASQSMAGELSGIMFLDQNSASRLDHATSPFGEGQSAHTLGDLAFGIQLVESSFVS